MSTDRNPNLLDLIPNTRLLRSKSVDTFLELDQKGKPSIVKRLNESLVSDQQFEQSFTTLEDPAEKVEAYKELTQTLNSIIRQERDDNLKNLEENSNFIKELHQENEILKTELELSNERLLNNKYLLEETNDKLYKTQDQLRKNDFTIFQEEICKLKEIIKQKDCELREYKTEFENRILPQSYMDYNEESDELKTKLQRAESEIEELKFQLQMSTPLVEFDKLQSELLETKTQFELFKKQNNNKISQLEPEKRFLNSQSQTVEPNIFNQNSKMDIEAKDIISAIPIFTGDMKQFDSFINTCGVYYDIVSETQKPFVLRIIKAKITGDALAKAGPFSDTLNTWELLKEKLKNTLRKPVSIEYAQEDLNNSFQKKDESIEEYGTRIKNKLKKLNDACRFLAKTDDEFKILRRMNEKQAVSKFEQNLRNQTIRVLVSASGKTSLDECITFAMQKDMVEKNKNIKQCGYCGLANHQENSCRKKQADENKHKFPQKSENKSNGNGKNNFRSSNNDRKQFQNDRKETFTAANQRNDNTNRFSQNKNQPQNFDKNKNANQGESSSKNFQQRNVKTLQSENTEEITVKEALQMLDESKN